METKELHANNSDIDTQSWKPKYFYLVVSIAFIANVILSGIGYYTDNNIYNSIVYPTLSASIIMCIILFYILYKK